MSEDDDDDVLLASAAIIILSTESSWISETTILDLAKPSSKEEMQHKDLIKDLVLDDIDLLNLEYRLGAGFKNFFPMTNTSFETLLNMIGPNISKCDTRMRSWSSTMVSTLHSSTRLPL